MNTTEAPQTLTVSPLPTLAEGGRWRDHFAPVFASIEADRAEREAAAERVERAAERGARAAAEDPRPLLTFGQAAKLMTVTARTVHNMIDRGELVPVAIPGTTCRRLRAEDVAAITAGAPA